MGGRRRLEGGLEDGGAESCCTALAGNGSVNGPRSQRDRVVQRGNDSHLFA